MPLDALGEKVVQITFDPLERPDDPLLNAPCSLSGFTLRGDLSGCDLGFASVPASAGTGMRKRRSRRARRCPVGIDRGQHRPGPDRAVVAAVDRQNLIGETPAPGSR